MSVANEVYIGIGSNLGDRGELIDQAVQAMQNIELTEVVKVSSIIETKPVGGPEQDDYLNAVALLETELSPDDLLVALQSIEHELGRVREVRWGPRTIDLDILSFGQNISDDPTLTIPHPRIQERFFVLAPLAEIAPDWIHPSSGETVQSLLKDVS